MKNTDLKIPENFPQKPEAGLYSKVIRGGFWVFALRTAQQVLALGKLVILARLISPEDFGLMGIAALSIGLLNQFTETGFQSALIQKKINLEAYLNSAWTFGIIRAAVLFTTLYLSADYIADFFNCPKAATVIQAIAAALLLGSFSNIGVIYFQKNLEFKKRFVYQTISMVTGFVVTVTFAILYKNVWALVYGKLTESLIGLIISYIAHPYRPKFKWESDKLKELWSFGKWLFLLTIFGFVASKGIDVFIGKFLSVTMLAFYQMAHRIAMLPATSLSDIISTVTFPAFSKIQDDIPRLKDAYFKTLQLTAFLSFPITGFIICFAPDFTLMLLGDKWMPMVAALQILALLGLNRSIGSTRPPIFQAIGQPQIVTKIQFIRICLLALLIYPMTNLWGIAGAGGSVLITGLFLQFYGMRLSTSILKCRLKEIIQPLVAPFILTLISMTIVTNLRISLFAEMGHSSYLSFFTLVFLAMGIYVSVFIATDRYWNSGVLPLLKEQWVMLKSPKQ